MSQNAPRVALKQVGLQKIDWIEPKELNAFLNSLLSRIDDLEKRIAALEAA